MSNTYKQQKNNKNKQNIKQNSKQNIKQNSKQNSKQNNNNQTNRSTETTLQQIHQLIHQPIHQFISKPTNASNNKLINAQKEQKTTIIQKNTKVMLVLTRSYKNKHTKKQANSGRSQCSSGTCGHTKRTRKSHTQGTHTHTHI